MAEQQDTRDFQSRVWRAEMFNGPRWAFTICAGVVLAIVTTIAPQIWGAISRVSIDFVSSFSQKTIDISYRSAVSHPEYKIIYVTLIIIVVMVFFWVLSANLIGSILGGYIPKVLDSVKKRNDNIWIERLENFFYHNGALKNWIHISIFLNYTILIIMYSVLLAVMNLSLVASEIQTRRMYILSMYTTASEKDALMSEWGRVSTKADFDKLMKHMDIIAARNHILLPKRSDI
jgi:hypothetical protein